MLKFFLPDWEDRLDPDFDFINDKYSEGHIKNPYKYDIYAHQLFDNPPYEGILVSLSVFHSKIGLKNKNDGVYTIRDYYNIKDYLRIQKKSNLAVMGDCGAFGYITEEKPPLPFYSVKNVSRLYNNLGFDYGVSVDHLVVDYVFEKDDATGKKIKRTFTQEEKDKRIELTRKNAKKFIELHKKNKYSYIPIGVAQGDSPETYKESVQWLVDLKYDYIALGGLVQYQTDFIIKVLKEIKPIINGKSLHLFGILRPNYLKEFENLGVTSFDSASYLRKAWLRSGQNYLSPNGKWYAAIRVPQSSNVRLLKNANLKGLTQKDIERMEKKALTSLIKYDDGEIEINKVLKDVLKYDSLLLRNSDDGDNLKEKYYRTLLEKPWKTCNCNICKKLGIQVVIFRGCNRNKRRGFHNTWIFRN